MNLSFSERIVVITGATGGVGAQVTRRWLVEGAKVVAVDRSLEHINRTFAELDETQRGRIAAAAVDITTADGAATAFATARDFFGKPADTLVHLVGGFAYGAFDDAGGADVYARMMALNVTSAVHAFRAALPGMRERGGGWITAMGARAATEPAAMMAAYAASKAALVSLVRSVALELRTENIHVNCMLASTIDTPANRAAMGDSVAGDWVTPDDIADASLFLCSEQARSVYGATLEVYAKS